MLNEAVRLEYLQKNPAVGIGKLKEHKRKRSIFTFKEVKSLFSNSAVDAVWGGDRRHFTLNLLAASTGMRLGECLALQRQHVHERYVNIVQNWDKKYGFKEPKWGSARQIPIPERTSCELRSLICFSPYQEPWHFVFTENGTSPFSHSTALRTLYRAIENIGISHDQRIERNLCFHSWRHFFNSIMRGKIHDAKLRQLTGHRTQAMTETYTHFSVDDFRDVLSIQEEYFG
jgi:integrase